MPYRYCHQNVEHLNDFLKKSAGLTEEIILKESVCPNCQEKNNINAQRCSKCNYILDTKLLMEELELKQKRQKEIDKQIRNYDVRINELETKNIEIMKLVERLIYDNLTPFKGPRLTPELKEIEEQIEQKALDEHNEQVKKQYKRHIENGDSVELVDMGGKLFLSIITEKTERFRKNFDILNAPFKDFITIKENADMDKHNRISEKYHKISTGKIKPKTKEEKEYKKASDEMNKFLEGSMISYTREEEDLFKKFKKWQEFNQISDKELKKFIEENKDLFFN